MSQSDDVGKSAESSEPVEVSAEYADRLKGDSIGDTLFSESWLLKTLIRLTDELPKYAAADGDDAPIELEEDLETDLCLLWDMTADQDVALCMVKHDIIQIVRAVLEASQAPRLTEIVVGILANIACQKEIGCQITQDSGLMGIVLNLLSSHDSQTIIQCVRLLDILLRVQQSDALLAIVHNQAIWAGIGFILQSSLNEELLCTTSKVLDLLVRQVADAGEFSIPFEDILRGIIESQTQLVNDNGSEQSFPSAVRGAFDALTSSLYNLSRIEQMRTSIREEGEAVIRFLIVYVSDLVRRRREPSQSADEMSATLDGAIEAATIYYTALGARTDSSKMFELMAVIGSALDANSQQSRDYEEVLGDCVRKLFHLCTAASVIDLIEPLDVKELNYLLRTARRCVPDKLAELISFATASGSYNKLVDTFESLDCVDTR